MNQGIRRVQLYDDRSNNYGAIINHYKDVYIDIVIHGKVLENIRVGDLEDNKDIEFTSGEMDIISEKAIELVNDQDFNFYILDITTKNVERYSVD